MRVLITGSTGFIGRALSAGLIGAGHDSVGLGRGPAESGQPTWDLAEGRVDEAAFDGIDAVVHLAGAPIGPWLTASRRDAIMRSRRDGTRLIAEAVAVARPEVFVSGSAIGIYGDAGDTELTEKSPKGEGFLADVVSQWEQATQPAVDAGVRTVQIRTGLVMDGGGGLLGQILLPYKLGLGGRIGSGRQWWSWITLRDEVGAIIHCLENPDLTGPVNIVGPNPVRNTDFVKALGSALHRPTVMPLPAFALKAIVGARFANEAVLASQRVIPSRLIESGFTFQDPEVAAALQSVL